MLTKIRTRPARSPYPDVAARIPELEQGRVDLLAASLTHNKEREAKVDFSLTTFITGQKVIVGSISFSK